MTDKAFNVIISGLRNGFQLRLATGTMISPIALHSQSGNAVLLAYDTAFKRERRRWRNIPLEDLEGVSVTDVKIQVDANTVDRWQDTLKTPIAYYLPWDF